MTHIQGMLEKSGQKLMYPSKQINCNHMEFVGYDTCEKSIWTSGEGIIITDKIRKQGIPKTHTNKIYPSSTYKGRIFLCTHTE